MPTPAEVRTLIEAAEESRRPEYARDILVAATTGLRRAELCALRRDRDVDLRAGVLRVSRSVVVLPGEPAQEVPTKNRRERTLVLDDLTVAVLRAQIDFVSRRAKQAQIDLVDDPFVSSDTPDGSQPWKPDGVSQYLSRLRLATRRAGGSWVVGASLCRVVARPLSAECRIGRRTREP